VNARRHSCSLFGIAGEVISSLPLWLMPVLAALFVVVNVALGLAR
jgi:hypothetical protein